MVDARRADGQEKRESKCRHPEAPEDDDIRLDDYCEDWEPYEVPEQQRKKLPWAYCECGCKGWDLNLGGIYFWLFWDLKDSWYLSRQHGRLGKLQRFKSAPEAEVVVIEALREGLTKRSEEQLAIKNILEQVDAGRS
jgi:hypothetical protein